MPFVSCSTFTASQAAQDAVINGKQVQLKDCAGVDLGAGATVPTCAQMTAAISIATPIATDAVPGKVALNLGNTAGDDANATDALTASGFNALANESGGAPNAVQLSIANSLNQSLGTVASASGTIMIPAPTLGVNASLSVIGSDGDIGTWGPGTFTVTNAGIYSIDFETNGAVSASGIGAVVAAAFITDPGGLAINDETVYFSSAGTLGANPATSQSNIQLPAGAVIQFKMAITDQPMIYISGTFDNRARVTRIR